MFALAVTVSVQLVGVYLVFASLIVPSLASASASAGAARWRSPTRSASAAMPIGLVLSAALDLPSGALIVWCLALLAVAVHATAPATSATKEAETLADGKHAAA